MTDATYKYLGNFAACEPWAAQGMSCDECMVSWTGCWDNFQCPKCGKGELPNCGDTSVRLTEVNRTDSEDDSTGSDRRLVD